MSGRYTLEERIAALRALSEAKTTSRADLGAAEDQLRQAIVDAVRPILPALCQPIHGVYGFTNGERIIALGDGHYMQDSGALLAPAGPLHTDRQIPALALADALSSAIDRQLTGNLPARVEEWRVQATIMRALAGALRGLDAARAPKKGR